MKAFSYDQPGTRVVFGTGALGRLPDELEKLGAKRAIIVTSPGRRNDAQEAAKHLGKLAAAIFSEAAMHVPIEVARAACDAAKRCEADCCIVIGGGSTVGLGKAIALETGVPVVAIPTTYSGSEMTPIYGFTEEGIKRTGRDRKVVPKTVMYDPVMAVSLPARMSSTSGMNAMAHCVVGLYAENVNPMMTLFAAEGIRALTQALPIIVREPGNLDARTDAFYGSWLAGSVLGMAGMSLHYKICHVLGGTFGLPHGEVHTVILPQVVGFTREAAPEAMRIAATALGAADAAAAIFDLAGRIGAPVSLKEIGMPADGLDRAAKLSTEAAVYNPRPADYASVLALLENAFNGRRP
jgi:alcohol dehydrogenase class IV